MGNITACQWQILKKGDAVSLVMMLWNRFFASLQAQPLAVGLALAALLILPARGESGEPLIWRDPKTEGNVSSALHCFRV